MIIIALAMIYCDSVKFWECFCVDRRRLFFFLVSARKLLDRLVFAEGKEYNKRRFGKRFLKCVL